ncbi:MAG: SRPBCC domain-containing protein [Bacteroidota bacterium]
MADIQHTVSIKAAAAGIYSALTTAEGIRQWWTEDVYLEEMVGGEGIFRFNYGKTVETVVRIIDLQERAHVAWEVVHSFRPEQDGTVISFSLSRHGDETILDLNQTGYIARDETFGLMNKGWAYYMVSLKRYLELGKGAPSPHLDFSIMDDNI